MQSVSVALIDANKLFREGLKALFTDRDFQISKEATSLNEALPLVSGGDAPQLLLIDPAGMGEVTQVVSALKAACPDARLVLLTGQMDANVMATAIQAGADGFLMKDISIEALAQSLRLVMMGEKVFPTHLAALLISGKVTGHAVSDNPGSRKGLSQREVQILRRLLAGDSNKMIANSLGITEATVKVHLKSLLRKINASNRTQAAIWALNNGFGESAGSDLAVA
ncbi:response regulator transcription factor [Azospirillum sp. SYSU D00513]|uniref:LuxR C-terminal-related transcriptional regulator n=1 Tax=Azospirillum sp. SYSU D00513 TaxID=2812561 RepID=UPI001A95E20D|nr:response regulator transcription factor [Azospirillum sp. SYSU D00513]